MATSVPTACPVFETHARCIGCGYDLFGQPRFGGLCPECGASTAASADSESFLALPGNAERLRTGARLLFVSSLLCGLCPAVCLLIAWGDGFGAVALLMTLIFAATAFTATIGHLRLRAMVVAADGAGRAVAIGSRANIVADVFAGIGLLVINVGAYWLAFDRNAEDACFVCAGIGFFLLCATAWRAALAGRFQSQIARAAVRTAGGMAALGYVKAVYETLWLACLSLGILFGKIESDAAIFFAYMAFFGLLGFGGIWLAMIIVHLNFYLRARRPGGGVRGFEVLVAPAVEA